MIQIIGKDKLEKIFGYWPNFHDAEIDRIILDRNPKPNKQTPALEMKIFVFEITNEVDESNVCKLAKQHFVTFEFSEIENLLLEDFNHQNVILELNITENEISENSQKFKVEFITSYGCNLSFLCSSIEIKDIQPVEEQK